MKQLSPIVVISFVLASCASTSDYEKLEKDFYAYKESTQNRQESVQHRQAQLEEDMKLFRMSYDPQAHDVFNKNVEQANKYYSEITYIKSDIDSINELIFRIKNEAEIAKNTVLDNARTSQSQNVVNEFAGLKWQWGNTVDEMSRMVSTAQQSVNQAQAAASGSFERAVTAEMAAKAVNDMGRNVNELMVSLTSISQRIANLEREIAADRRKDSDTQVLARLKAVSEKIDTMEKQMGRRGPPAGPPGPARPPR